MGCIYSHVNEEGNLLSNISAINANHRQYATYFNSVSCGPKRNRLTKRCNKTSTVLELQAHKLAGDTINKRKTGCSGNSKPPSWVTLYLSEVAKLVASTNPELQQLQSCNRHGDVNRLDNSLKLGNGDILLIPLTAQHTTALIMRMLCDDPLDSKTEQERLVVAEKKLQACISEVASNPILLPRLCI